MSFSKYYSELINSYNFFKLIVKLFLKLKKIKKYNIKKTIKKKVNIYIGDWLSSPLFQFTLYLGLILNKEYKVTFLFDKYNLYDHSRSIFINYLCFKILKYVKKKFDVNYIVLGDVFAKKTKFKFKDETLKKMYIFNKMRYQRDAEVKIVKNNYYQYKKRLAAQIFDHLEHLIEK